MNNEEENTTSSHSPTLVLQKGIVLFKKRLSLNEQKSLVETANDLNLGSTSFRCHNEKARHMQMRTLKHPRIPPILVDLYSNLINEAELASPAVAPTRRLGVCVANQYSAISRLSLHDELGTRGAVVSMSVGDSAVFVYKNSWKKKSLLKRIILESGDVLVFGGVARGIAHGVESIKPNTCPSELQELVQGRINFNIREK